MKHYLFILFFHSFSEWINAQQISPLYSGAPSDSLIKSGIEKRTERRNGNYIMKYISRRTLSVYLQENKKEIGGLSFLVGDLFSSLFPSWHCRYVGGVKACPIGRWVNSSIFIVS